MKKVFDIGNSTLRTEAKPRRRPERLTVDLPKGTLAALKVHAAQRQTTIREVITNLVTKEIEGEAK